jgi:hypothetical protein
MGMFTWVALDWLRSLIRSQLGAVAFTRVALLRL